MRLLTRVEVSKIKQQERDMQIQRGIKLAHLVDDKAKKLNDLTDYYKSEQKKLSDEFEAFSTKIEKDRTELLDKVISLELRKSNALKPLDEIKASIKKREEQLADNEKILSIRNKSVNDLISKLDNDRIELTHRQSELDKFEDSLNIRTSNLIKDEEALNDRYKVFSNECIEQNKKVVADEKKIADKYYVIKEKTAILNGEIQIFNDEKKQFEKDKKLFESNRAALEAAFQEAKKKGII